MQVSRVPLSILAALGLLAGCDETANHPCLSVAPPQDDGVHPCLKVAEEPPAHPCLNVQAIDDEGKRPSGQQPPGAEGGGGKAPTEPETKIGPCLKVAGPEVRPCLDVPAEPEAGPCLEVPVQPCLRVRPPEKKPKQNKCLSMKPVPQPKGEGGGMASAADRDALLERLIDGDVLPDDVARRLRRDKPT